MHVRTWKVIDWSSRPKDIIEGEPVLLTCDCGYDAWCPTAGQIDALLIAGFGMRFVFEPSDYIPSLYWLPDSIQCRKCRRIYETQGSAKKCMANSTKAPSPVQ